MRIVASPGCVLAALLVSACSSEVQNTEPPAPTPTPAPPFASLVADYGGPCWLVAGAVRCWNPGLNLKGLESGVKALYGSPCAFGSCAEKLDGTFLCWDDMLHYPDKTLPPPITLVAPPGRTIESVARGEKLTCTRQDDGSVACQGQFAAGSETLVVGVDGAGVIGALKGKKATLIAAGTGHACARIDDGSVVCWGTNDFGELGFIGTNAPPGVPGLPANVAQLGAGQHFSCARTDDGAVYCWGAMQGDTASPPTRVAGLPPVIDMGVAEHNVCARAYDDALYCWGDDAGGQSGVLPAMMTVAPTRVGGITGTVRELGPSGIAYYARTTDGKVWGWGIFGGDTNEAPHVIAN